VPDECPFGQLAEGDEGDRRDVADELAAEGVRDAAAEET
jgi:hypothetical protein